MRRASYRHAIAWIGENDNPGCDEDCLDPAALETYISVLLTADLFGVDQSKVARDVVAYRITEGAKTE